MFKQGKLHELNVLLSRCLYDQLVFVMIAVNKLYKNDEVCSLCALCASYNLVDA